MENSFSQTPWVSKVYSFPFSSVSYERYKMSIASLELKRFTSIGGALLAPNIKSESSPLSVKPLFCIDFNVFKIKLSVFHVINLFECKTCVSGIKNLHPSYMCRM